MSGAGGREEAGDSKSVAGVAGVASAYKAVAVDFVIDWVLSDRATTTTITSATTVHQGNDNITPTTSSKIVLPASSSWLQPRLMYS